MQLAFGFLLAAAVTRYAGGLLKDLAAFRALARYYLRYSALTYDGVAVSAKACIHKQAVNVLETNCLAVYVILTLAAAVIAACEHKLGIIAIKDMLGIVDNQRYLCKAQCPPLLRTAEDDILHLAAAQSFGTLLAHDPQYRIGYIRFARAVRSDYCGNVLFKCYPNLVRKGLKPLYFQCF